MQHKAITSGIVIFLLLSTGFVSLSAEEDSPSFDTDWWDVYSRDKNHDGISDLLIWKLAQGELIFNPVAARVVGVMALTGKGAKRDPAIAKEWLSVAAQKGDKTAQRLLETYKSLF